LNARYAHASLGLRYLRANLGALREHSCIREFVIGQKSEEIVEKILAEQPRIIGLGVYIWNVTATTSWSRCSSASAPRSSLSWAVPKSATRPKASPSST
jgi:hypothetical protein